MYALTIPLESEQASIIFPHHILRILSTGFDLVTLMAKQAYQALCFVLCVSGSQLQTRGVRTLGPWTSASCCVMRRPEPRGQRSDCFVCRTWFSLMFARQAHGYVSAASSQGATGGKDQREIHCSSNYAPCAYDNNPTQQIVHHRARHIQRPVIYPELVMSPGLIALSDYRTIGLPWVQNFRIQQRDRLYENSHSHYNPHQLTMQYVSLCTYLLSCVVRPPKATFQRKTSSSAPAYSLNDTASLLLHCRLPQLFDTRSSPPQDGFRYTHTIPQTPAQ
ncbi:hypothetical protein BJ170DRAFT_732606 [Xylariales sp. AK1849]|nr:hypothetical protein BJ170DRAFT_732606 [Xylariales sp. AK1849]